MEVNISRVKETNGWKYQEQKMIIPSTSGMEYVNDINIIEAVIHVLDSTNEEPILNNYKVDLTDDIYKFLYKHIDKCFNSTDLKYAAFKEEKRIVKDVTQEFLNGVTTDIIKVSQELAKQLFYIMRANKDIPNCDLITVSISTDQGPMLAILKMDYVKNFTHKVDFVDNKLGIGIIEQQTGLPPSGHKVHKCAFIRLIREGQDVDLMIIDKQKRIKDETGFITEYFTKNYLACTVINNQRDMTKNFINATEQWARNNLSNDAAKAVDIRAGIKNKLKQEDVIDINEVAKEVLAVEEIEDFKSYIESQGVEENVTIDKNFVEKKLKRIRLNLDREIDIYLNDDIYSDSEKFEIIRNGDGTINIILKRIRNYIEK